MRLKTPWRDGTTHLVLSDEELVQRLAALVPPPRANLVTYYGVLAPADRWRSQVVPEADEEDEAPVRKACCAKRPHARWIEWAELMRRVFAVDVLRCLRFGDRLEVHAVVKSPWSAARVLEWLAAGSVGPPPRAGPGEGLERVVFDG